MNPSFSNDKPLNASGRFGRLSYLGWVMLSSIVMMILLSILLSIFGLAFNPQNISIGPLIPYIIVYLVFIYISIVFMIRRLHDRNHSGWLSLLVLIPVANIIFMLYLVFAKGDVAPNNYGSPRSTATWEKVLAWFYIALFPLGILAAIAIPSYQDYVERSQIQQYEQIQQHQQN